MTKDKLMQDIFKWSVLATVVSVAFPEMSLAANIGAGLKGVQTDISTLPKLVSGIAYVIGGALGIIGGLKLKKHAENPAQEKMGPGLVTLLVGGGIAALPSLIQTMTDTLRISGNASYTSLSNI